MDYRPALRALMNVKLEIENARFEVAQLQGGSYAGEQIVTLDQARNFVDSLFWALSQAQITKEVR